MAEEEKEIELPVEPIEVSTDQAITATDSGKTSNMGVIVLSVAVVLLCMVIIYYVFIDKKMGNSSTRMNNNSMKMGNSSTRMNNNSMMPILNRAPQALNSINMSSNGGYGYKANAF
jgi:phosphoglycerate-specific signal transduction histidine kinase